MTKQQHLIIVESPSKAPTIEKYLRGDAVVLATKGHVRDLPQKTLGIDVEHDYKPQYVVSPDKEDVVKRISNEIKSGKYDKVYLATDPDREGEAISWHLKEVLGLDDRNCRIEFNEITENVIRHALDNPRDINMNLVDSQQARRVLDRLVGYKISPILSRKLKPNLSAGRVQSAALKMLVDREREIDEFKPEEYWIISAFLNKDEAKRSSGESFRAFFNDFNGKKVKIDNREDAEKVVDFMQHSAYAVDNVDSGVAKVSAQPPFTTSTMQQEASHKLNFSAENTNRIAQQLYEGVKFKNGGQEALITYIRTDSVRVSPEFAAHTLDYIRGKYGKDFAPSRPNTYKTSASAQDAHEAIRPTHLERTPESVKDQISVEQYKLYKLIYERFLASQMTQAQYNTMKVHIAGTSSNGPVLGFVVKGRSVRFAGYTAVYSVTVEKKDDDEDELGILPDLKQGEPLYLEKIKPEQKFTKPPARYNDATIVKAMEENGIGRPSTYASIISVLTKRSYIDRKGKSMCPTELGKEVCAYMVQNFPDIMDLTFTARMEGALDKIAEGGEQWQELISAFYPRLLKFIQLAQKGSGAPKSAGIPSGVICDKCGAEMVIREGKYGPFLACPNYPNCKNIKKIVEKVGTCPKCGGAVEKKVSKTGKVFYGCSNYPKCDFISWDVPAPYLCPNCGSMMKVVMRGDQKKYVCINKECKHIETPKDEEKIEE